MSKKKSTFFAFLLGSVFMLAIIISGSYVAMVREERVYIKSGYGDEGEINMIYARENLFRNLLTFPRRIFKVRSSDFGTLHVGSIKVQGDWATVGVAGADRYTCRVHDAGPGLRIVRKIDGVWQNAKNSDENRDWIDEVPETLVDPSVKEILR